MEQKIINYIKTGYRPPKWEESLYFFIKEIFTGKPSSVDLTKASTIGFPDSFTTNLAQIPPLMQGLIPDCVENAVTFVKMYYDYKKTGIVPDLSAWFLFNISSPSENGTSLKLALEEARTVGIAERKFIPDPDTTIPYNGIKVYPNSQAIANAASHKISAYAYTTNMKSLNLNALISQFGLVIVGMTIDNKWWLPSWDNLLMPLTPPSSNSATLSDHCDILFGYNGQIHSVRNSWSALWGNGGDGTISADYINSIYELAVLTD